jgi:hypothetical protein
LQTVLDSLCFRRTALVINILGKTAVKGDKFGSTWYARHTTRDEQTRNDIKELLSDQTLTCTVILSLHHLLPSYKQSCRQCYHLVSRQALFR